MMRLIWQCLFSPRLYKVYRDGPPESMYQPQGLEKFADKVITTANTILNISLYASPCIIAYIYRRGFFTIEETKSLARFFGGLSCLIAFSLVLRAYGRSTSTKYVNFINALKNRTSDKNAYLTELRKFDFDPEAWPTTYGQAENESFITDPIIKMDPKFVGTSWKDMHPFKECANLHLPLYQRAPIQILAFVATHTFGLRLIYPGCVRVLQNLFWTSLFQGRAQLVEVYNGQRARIRAEDGNIIDTMFVDNRAHSQRGKTLVICCEGNSGYYEIGIMNTPIKAGYSALGWNHPGFAGSTGLPYPSQEQLAIDVVMQYAINELGFRPDKIVLLGWSIGGYAAASAACDYPVGGLILDATFDDLLPLAQNQMPRSWSLLVKEVVRSYVNLDIAELVNNYFGPLQLIRRTEDEIISLRQGNLFSNRGNNLLLKVIDERHPDILLDPLATVEFNRQIKLVGDQRTTTSEMGPDDIELMELVNKYMYDVKSLHCAPLPESDFIKVMERIEKAWHELVE